MLYVSMNRSDYVVVDGNIFVGYGKKNGNGIRVWIDAPAEIDITRGTFYEKELLKLTKEGNTAAKELLERLEREHDERIEKSRVRQAKLAAQRHKEQAIGKRERVIAENTEPTRQWDILKTTGTIEGAVKVKTKRMRSYVSP